MADESNNNFRAILNRDEAVEAVGSVHRAMEAVLSEEDVNSVAARDRLRTAEVRAVDLAAAAEFNESAVADPDSEDVAYVDPSLITRVELDPDVINAIDWDNLYTDQQEGTQEFNLGTNSRPWGAIYAQNGVVQTSDMNAKRFIRDCDLGLSFVMGLRPVSFTWRNQQSMVPTFGFLGQQVETALKGRGFAGLHQDEGGYSLRYVDFIAPMVKSIQQQQEQIKALKQEISELRELIASRG